MLSKTPHPTLFKNFSEISFLFFLSACIWRIQRHPSLTPQFALMGSSLGCTVLHRSVQNCKQFFMYMNNWDKGVAPQICPSYLVLGNIDYQPELLPQNSADQWRVVCSKWGSKYVGGNNWSPTYLLRVLYHVMDTLISGWFFIDLHKAVLHGVA